MYKQISSVSFLFSFLFLLFSINTSAQAPNLMPLPASYTTGSGKLELNNQFTIGYQLPKGDSIVLPAINRFYRFLKQIALIYPDVDFITEKSNRKSPTLFVEIGQNAVMGPDTDESYTLEINNTSAVIKAANSIGGLRALTSLIQLVQRDHSGAYWPEIKIEDHPKFAWRGLMIDVSRHFIPADVIKRNIEAMSLVKLNVLHWHLTDDQGFRVESLRFPELQRKGSNGEFYTQSQIREIIRFAGERGIMVVPEFDLPGHSTSWLAAYPNLASSKGPFSPGSPVQIDRSQPFDLMKIMQVMNTTPLPSIDPTREEVFQFFDQFFSEMAGLFPSEYIHIGADENNGVAWKQNPSISAFMEKKGMKTPHELQSYFVSRIYGILRKHHKKVLAWEEALNPDLPKDVIVQVWKPGSTLYAKVASQGNPILISSGFYLDHFMPAFIHYQAPIPKEIKLGGEGAIWTEIANSENIETRIWPRMAVVAEKFWSLETNTDLDNLYDRMFHIGHLLDAGGSMYFANYERMLRIISDSNNSEYEQLVDVLNPVKGYKRLFGLMSKPGGYAAATAPLLRVADIAMVDPEKKYQFRKLVTRWLATHDHSTGEEIKGWLDGWIQLESELANHPAPNPILEEITPHIHNLYRLSKAAKEAMSFYQDQREPGAEWLNTQQSLIKDSSTPVGETELAVLPELSALITGKLEPYPKNFPLF